MGRRTVQLMILIGLVTVTAGCSSIGPQTLPRDRLDYSDAVASSWQRQMLLNIVKLRYGEMPMFLDVSSVINQYTATGSASATLIPGGNDEFGAGGSFSDRPTVTFTPLTGEKFTTSLLTPLSPVSLFSLVQSGWPVESVFQICVRRINGVPNISSGLVRSQGAPEFQELLARMSSLQQGGRLAMRLQSVEEGVSGAKSGVFLIIGHPTAEMEADGRRVREILSLEPERGEISVSYGALQTEAGEIAILSRSVLDIMLEMAYSADVPADDVASGRAGPSIYDSLDDPSGSKLIRIRSGEEMPAGTRISVRYRDMWFWIDDTDLRSKLVLAFLLTLFSLSEGEAAGTAPVLTIN
jgi:hypothetical protein